MEEQTLGGDWPVGSTSKLPCVFPPHPHYALSPGQAQGGCSGQLVSETSTGLGSGS